ncbi:MAG TPA: hypothetical protein VGE91_05170 [Solirubrobacterales bacterium]
MKSKRGITIRVGPLGLSLLAAGITAVGVAAVSFADSGDSGGAKGGADTQTFQMPTPGGVGGVRIAAPNLSAADRQKLEDFRSCMEDNGAPAPPRPRRFDPSDGPPKPPSAADMEKARKAFEACKGKLPERLRNAGPPGFHTFKCGPGPGAPGSEGKDQEQGQNQDQSDQPGTQSSGSSA